MITTIYVDERRPEFEVDSNRHTDLSTAELCWNAEEWKRDEINHKELLISTSVSIRFLRNRSNVFDPRPRFLQRNDLKNEEKSEGMVYTILTGGFLPQIILRVITPNQKNCLPANRKTIQLVDGLQRYSALTRFINGEFGVGLGGKKKLKWNDLDEDQKNKILDFNFQTMIYVNTSNQNISEAFRKFNLGSTRLNQPEINNSIISQFIDATRNAEDGNDELEIKPHNLYAMTELKDKPGKRYKYFEKSFQNKRFDVCDWDHTLMFCFDELRNPNSTGWFVLQAKIAQEIESRSKNGGKWELNNELWQEDDQRYSQVRNKIKQLFSNIEPTKRSYMKRWQALYLAMTYLEYGDTKYSVKGTQVDHQNGGLKKFVTKWFKMAVKWDNVNVYTKNKDGSSPRMQSGGNKNKPMESFSASFSGFNLNQYKTFKQMFTEEWLPDNASDELLNEWGLVRVAKKRTFVRKEVVLKWHQNDCRCWYTDEKMESESELEGDHMVVYSQGGSTDIDNCAPTSIEVHSLRGTMPLEEFIPYLKQQGYNIAKRWQSYIK